MNERIYNNPIDKLRSPERMARLELGKVIEFCLKDNSIQTILDIGTGSGIFAEAFNNEGIEATGIDINEDMLSAARKFAPMSDFVIGSAEKIPFADKSFDAAFMGMVFHEVSDYKASLLEAKRVTKKFTFILEWKFKTEDYSPPLEHRLTPEFIKNLAKEVGFKAVSEYQLSNLVLYELSLG
ncbi:MAG: methyltransferase domain-containing protein [bacterium]